MNDLVLKQNNLPDNIKDLSKFVLVGREKLTSVKAEIRAIDKLNLATEVRDQKKQECSMLAEALLDAETRLGDLLKQIPKTKNQYTGKMVVRTATNNQKPRTDLSSSHRCEELKRTNQYRSAMDSGVDSSREIDSSHCCEMSKGMVSDTGAPKFEKPKHEVIKELGFNKDQANRFEILANNKDLVEKVKNEARENDDLPTRTRVLELAKVRRKKEPEDVKEYCDYMDECKKIAVNFNNTLLKISLLDADNKTLSMWQKLLNKDDVERKLEKVEDAIPKLLKIQKFLKEVLKNG
ncbi:hypothetical protein [Clostridium tyrobutyricum]|uniref:hypothetical protein n=1 Tax=Clostridium tyrobutyricum TaxID=1519 RepID=UPI001C383AB3|nr:hypothetical protein [Clostridium tyrobutyricum]MBV4417432.1 hypothetical protein [Clostridium tyrobutyricum]